MLPAPQSRFLFLLNVCLCRVSVALAHPLGTLLGVGTGWLEGDSPGTTKWTVVPGSFVGFRSQAMWPPTGELCVLAVDLLSSGSQLREWPGIAAYRELLSIAVTGTRGPV